MHWVPDCLDQIMTPDQIHSENACSPERPDSQIHRRDMVVFPRIGRLPRDLRAGQFGPDLIQALGEQAPSLCCRFGSVSPPSIDLVPGQSGKVYAHWLTAHGNPLYGIRNRPAVGPVRDCDRRARGPPPGVSGLVLRPTPARRLPPPRPELGQEDR
jgi:hypothetical protein